MRSAETSVMSAVARETFPDWPEEQMSDAISRLDTSDPIIGARIMGTAFPDRSNEYYCRGMGDVGKGILKDTPGFQRKKGASSSRQSSEMQEMRSQMDTVKQAATTVYEITNANNAALADWMTSYLEASSQGLPPPPRPVPIPMPEWPEPSQQQPSRSPDIDLDNVDFTID